MCNRAHGVRYLTYWFEPDSGSVFCLAEGPSIEAVEQVHREAHGQIAGNIIEVEPGPVQAFFGSLPEHPVGESYAASAVRAVLFTDICGSTEMTERLGDDRAIALLHEHDGIVRDALAMHDGREVKHTGDGIMASFASVSSAVEAAIAMQRRLAAREERPDARAGSSHRDQRRRAGERSRRPVRGRSATRGSSLLELESPRHHRVGGSARAVRRQAVPLRAARSGGPEGLLRTHARLRGPLAVVETEWQGARTPR